MMCLKVMIALVLNVRTELYQIFFFLRIQRQRRMHLARMSNQLQKGFATKS